ncbi:MAG: hypothetical protein NUW07_00110 [Candidatus Saccharicenans sp.]|nr:hypothetical protein [Candidatus Saccharicenans sp.]MDH7493136.1 hypothetical protein [Candidatus Saccharicenans sp.]
MKKQLFQVFGFWMGLLLLVAVSPLLAQQSRDVTFQVTLAEWYDLYLGTNTVTFTDIAPTVGQTPGTVQIAANENPVDVRVFAIMVPASSLSLTVTAGSDFHTTVPASTVSWTVSGAGYQAGSLQAGTAVTVGQWTGSIFHWHEGQLNFSFLRDYVNQEPGTYSIVATYTLSKI